MLLPEASPCCVSSRKIPEAEKQNRCIFFHEPIITESLLKSALFLFLCIFIQGCLDWACMTDCLKAWKWEALSRWKWNTSTKCDPHEIALAVNGVPWYSVTVPSTFMMHEHVLKLTQILNLLVDHFSYLCFLCNYFTENKIWERYKNENRTDFWIQFN